jgi:hypothetical protein
MARGSDQAGFNAGDMKNYFLIDKSFKSQAIP